MKSFYNAINDLMVMKSLVYFDDAELEPDPVTPLGVTWEEVKLRLLQIVSSV